MRNRGLAGAAMIGAAVAYAGPVRADDAVRLYIGGRVFESIFVQSVQDQNPYPSPGIELQQYNFQNYLRLYPGVEYTAPNGIHYGIIAELRWGGQRGALSPKQTGPASPVQTESGAGYVDRAYAFVRSDRLGTLSFGGQPGALADAAVANDEASGTGGWDGEYSFFGNRGGVPWLLADTVSDGTLAIKYTSPSLAGVGLIVSFIPDSSALVGASTFISSFDPARYTGEGPSFVKNRIEGALTFAGQFGGFGVSANLGGAVGSPEATVGHQDLGVFDAGLQGTYRNISLGAHYDGGKFADAFDVLPNGAGNTQAYNVGLLYTIAAMQVGVQYYGYTTPVLSDPSNNERFGGAALGAKWVVNPGVTLFFDGLFGAKNITGAPRSNYNGVGLGTYFQW